MYAFSISEVYFFADIIGSVIVIFAFSKLAQYNRYFVGAMWLCLTFLGLCSVSAASLMFELYAPSSALAYTVSFLKLGVSCAMHIVMFLGIRGIALGAESAKLASSSFRSAVTTTFYYALNAVLSAVSLIVGGEGMIAYLSGVLYIFYLGCIILNLVLFYKCFGTICPADEDDNEVKRSKFALINKMNDKMDELEKKSNEYKRESIKLAMDEAERRAALKSKKHKQKKK